MKPQSLNYGKCRHTSGAGEVRVEEGGVFRESRKKDQIRNVKALKSGQVGVQNVGRKNGCLVSK